MSVCVDVLLCACVSCAQQEQAVQSKTACSGKGSVHIYVRASRLAMQQAVPENDIYFQMQRLRTQLSCCEAIHQLDLTNMAGATGPLHAALQGQHLDAPEGLQRAGYTHLI